MNTRSIPLLLVLILSPWVSATGADPAATSGESRLLRVGVAPDEPFDMKRGDVHEGFCIELWQAIAGDLGIKYRYIDYPNFEELLRATERGEIDLNANSLHVTSERLGKMEFTIPFLQGGMQVMVNENRTASLGKLWNGLRDSGHLMIFVIGGIVILAATLLLTVAERRWNGDFHPDWGNGLAESFYHVMSITMTGKSSHKELPGPWGKVLSGIWIACGVAVVAYITSSVTSVMTFNKLHGIINGPKDLPGHSVAVVRGTVGETYCREARLEARVFDTLREAVTSLAERRVDAVVYDAMSLQWYDNSHPELPITEVGPIFSKKYCAYALPSGNPMRRDINMALLRRHESGYIEELKKRYFGDIE